MEQTVDRIVSDDDVLGVLFIKECVEDRSLEPRSVADRYDLDIADVYRALAYYHDNPGEMKEVEKERRPLKNTVT